MVVFGDHFSERLLQLFHIGGGGQLVRVMHGAHFQFFLYLYCVTIYLLFLSKCLLSYLIFSAYHYLIFRPVTPWSLRKSSHCHTPPTCHILGYRVFALFIF